MRFLRLAGAFVVNLFAAALVPNFFESDLSHIFRPRTPAGTLYGAYFVGALVAVAVGYFVYYKWRSAATKWVWIAGVLLFAQQALSFWQEQYSRHSVLEGKPGALAAALQIFGPVYVPQRTFYAFILVRTFFYSMGA